MNNSKNHNFDIYQFPVAVEVNGSLRIIFPSRVTEDSLNQMKKENPYTTSCQMFLKPVSEEDQKFKAEWLRKWKPSWLNDKSQKFIIIITVDPANTIKKKSDYTAITVHGFDINQNWWILDIYRDKLALESERADRVFFFHQKWQPYAQNRIPVLYETLNFQISDKHMIERRQMEKAYAFEVIGMSGGGMHTGSKADRIKSLQSYFYSNTIPDGKKIYIPESCLYYSNFDKRPVDMVEEFINEYLFFTTTSTYGHDDILDTISFVPYWEGFKRSRATPRKDFPITTPELTVKQLEKMLMNSGNKVTFYSNTGMKY